MARKQGARQLSGAAGLFAFIGSALFFLSSNAVIQWERMYGADIEVLNVSSQKALTLFNNSSVDVLFENVTFKMPGEIELFVVINESLDARSSSNIDLGDLFERQTTGPLRRQFGRSVTGRQVIKSEYEADKLALIASNLAANDYGWDETLDERFTVEAINSGGADWNFFGAENADYLSVECRIEIKYQVNRGGSFILQPPCIGVVKMIEGLREGEAMPDDGLYRLEQVSP
ncbi:hypothetical protein [uncultured Tateyamaria sp.]|uniref:hypothetical protein n=1 Tax=uncultured Tateyamaria sp. TaxID=455651 RepID=UPI0026292868|nr:hypothetical protein [uncultured Tateyamaria sp.]